MPVNCSAEGCSDTRVATVEGRSYCRKHFLSSAYRYLESISSQILQAQFHESHADAAGKFLEDCMRHAADIACEPVPPGNLERAQVLDILLWASELHGKLRRGPRVAASMAILLRCEIPDQSWEERTETRLLSRHGLQISCSHELKVNDLLTCVRLDNNRKVEARVVWARTSDAGRTEAGLEFTTEENFWGLKAVSGTLMAPVGPKR